MIGFAQIGSSKTRCSTAVALVFTFTLTAFITTDTYACHRDDQPHGKETQCPPPDGGDGGHNTGGGGGQGGFGELGNACLNLPETGPIVASGKIANDGESVYCHGEDGQISVPNRFRIDTKKFNGNDSSYWVNAECSHAWCGGDQELKIFQSQLWYNQDGTLYNPANIPEADFNGKELNFQEMKPNGYAERVSMSVAAVDKDYRLLFAKDSGGSFRCEGVSDGAETGPVWVECTADNNGDGLCDRWTITTNDLNCSDGPCPTAKACLKVKDVLDETEVIADFWVDVCVLGAGELAPCPISDWEPEP